MIDFNQVFQMLPGYTLGGVISKWTLGLPIFEKSRSEISCELERLNLAIQQARRETNSQGQDQQKIVNTYVIEKLKKQNELKEVIKQIQECFNNSETVPIVLTLPLEQKYARVIKNNKDSRPERLELLNIEGNRPVLPQIQELVAKLFLQDVSATILPEGSLESLARSVEDLLNNHTFAASVTLVGSCITLERVKLITPLRLRSVGWLKGEFKKNAANYFVISELELGGVFLGIGRSLARVDPQNITSSDERNHFPATVSFFSQGAIPKIHPKIEEANLWTVYTDWKNSVLEDDKSGYPIGFKVKSLIDVLAQNGIFLNHLEE